MRNRHMGKRYNFTRFLIIKLKMLTMICMAVSITTNSFGKDSTIKVDIAAKDVVEALSEFADVTNYSIVYVLDDLSGAKTKSVSGEYTPQKILELMLDGTGLEIEFTSKTTVSVRKVQPLLVPDNATPN